MLPRYSDKMSFRECASFEVSTAHTDTHAPTRSHTKTQADTHPERELHYVLHLLAISSDPRQAHSFCVIHGRNLNSSRCTMHQ